MRTRRLVLTILIITTACSFAVVGLARQTGHVDKGGRWRTPHGVHGDRNELRELIEKHGLPFLLTNDEAELAANAQAPSAVA